MPTNVERKGPTLMTIPSEVRRMILRHLLVLPSNVRPYEDPKMGLWTPSLRLCKTIHTEGVDILFKENTFEFQDHDKATMFLKETASYHKLLRHVRIECCSSSIIQDRQNQPIHNHITQGYQQNYTSLRDLAGNQLGWITVLKMLPPTLRSISISPYDFVKDRCFHKKFPERWLPTATYYCAGCGLQHFALCHSIQDFLPEALADKVVVEKVSEPVLFSVECRKAGTLTDLNARRRFLERVARGEVKRVYNVVCPMWYTSSGRHAACICNSSWGCFGRHCWRYKGQSAWVLFHILGEDSW